MRTIAVPLGLSLGLIAMPAGLQAPTGRALAANCFQCHGTDGRAAPGMPSIAGKDEVANDMLEYKRRTNLRDIMVLQARAYTDAQLGRIGAYFASVPEHLGEARSRPQSGLGLPLPFGRAPSSR